MAIDVVRHLPGVAVVDDGEMRPLTEPLRREDAERVVVRALAFRIALDAEDELSGLADLPVDASGFPAVGEQQGVVDVRQAVHADPGGERQRLEIAGHLQPDAITDAFEFETLLTE